MKLAARLQQLNTPVSALILQSAYSSIKAVAFDLVGPYLPLCMVDRWESYKYLVGNYINEGIVNLIIYELQQIIYLLTQLKQSL